MFCIAPGAFIWRNMVCLRKIKTDIYTSMHKTKFTTLPRSKRPELIKNKRYKANQPIIRHHILKLTVNYKFRNSDCLVHLALLIRNFVTFRFRNILRTLLKNVNFRDVYRISLRMLTTFTPQNKMCLWNTIAWVKKTRGPWWPFITPLADTWEFVWNIRPRRRTKIGSHEF